MVHVENISENKILGIEKDDVRLIEDSIALICSGDISTSYCGHGHADSFIRLAELHKS